MAWARGEVASTLEDFGDCGSLWRESEKSAREGRDHPNVWAIVLAGGQGTRLQKFLRQVLGTDRPKQFCRIIGARSMLRHTWDRAVQVVDASRVVTIITAGQEDYLGDEAETGMPGTLLVQPANKETGPGLLLPLLWIAERQPGATVIVLPADHFIWEEGRFIVHATNAIRAAQWFPDRLVILGAEADGPEQSYGWVAPGAPCEVSSTFELNWVRQFWEKPQRAVAARLFANGYLWNTFILAGQVDAFVRSARASMPQVLEPLTRASAFLDTRYESDVLAATYRNLRPVNFSKTLLAARPEDLLVLAARNMYWSDWGSPERILRTLVRFNRLPHWLPAYARRMPDYLKPSPGDVRLF